MRRFTSWIFFAVIVLCAVGVIWYFAHSQSGNTSFEQQTAIVADSSAPATEATPTSSIAVPTTTAMQLSDPAQTTLPGTLVVDDASTVNSADGAWSASMQMIKEYPITYSFNDGAGPSLIVDDAYLLIANVKTGASKQIAVLDLAPDKMIAAAKGAAAKKQFEYVTYNLAWTAGGAAGVQLTGRAELYDVTGGTASAKEVQAATFSVDPATGIIAKKSQNVPL